MRFTLTSYICHSFTSVSDSLPAVGGFDFLTDIVNQVTEANDQAVVVPVGTVNHVTKVELAAYLAAPMLPLTVTSAVEEQEETVEEEIEVDPDAKPPKIKYNNPLFWWKHHEAFFPILACLARQYLSVQATSAASERVFSAAERIIGTRRASLDPETAGRLLYVSRNWETYLGQMSLEDALEQIVGQVE